MKNQKKEGSFYAAKVRLFLNEYGGIDLEEFCKADVSVTPRCATALVVLLIVNLILVLTTYRS